MNAESISSVRSAITVDTDFARANDIIDDAHAAICLSVSDDACDEICAKVGAEVANATRESTHRATIAATDTATHAAIDANKHDAH